MKFSNFRHYFTVKLKLKNHINQKQSVNVSTANNTDTPENTVDTILVVFVVEQIISHRHARTHEMSLRNASTVPKATQPTTKAAQYTKNFNIEKYPVHQVIE
jgi:hypothetical protein